MHIDSLNMHVPQLLTFGFINVVASKCGFDVFGPQRIVTNSAAHIKEYIEGTIDRLGFTPDLYYLHRIDPSKSSPYSGDGEKLFEPNTNLLIRYSPGGVHWRLG